MKFVVLDFFKNIIKFILLAIIKVILIFILFAILNKVLKFALFRILNSIKYSSSKQRINTIYKILSNLITYTIGIIVFIVILIFWGIPWQGLIASAGAIGIVIGIGAQGLITDAVNGFFVVFEGIYDIGEYVQIGEYEGFVIDLGIKSTTLRTYENQKVTIPNSKVQEVINFSKNYYNIYYYFGTSYDEKIETIENIIDKHILPMIQKNPDVVKVKYIGLDEFQSSAITYGLLITTPPEKRFSTKRSTNAVIKTVFDAQGIEIPYQNITINYKGEKNA